MHSPYGKDYEAHSLLLQERERACLCNSKTRRQSIQARGYSWEGGGELTAFLQFLPPLCSEEAGAGGREAGGSTGMCPTQEGAVGRPLLFSLVSSAENLLCN